MVEPFTQCSFEPRVQEKIVCLTIKVLQSRFQSFPRDRIEFKNVPFHEAFLKAFKKDLPPNLEIPELISLASWMHGLSTSLGSTYFEGIAHILSGGLKKSYTEKSGRRLTITVDQQESIQTIVRELKNRQRVPDVCRENQEILNNSEADDMEAMDFTVDNYLESTESIECIELKTVRPNAGEMRVEKEKMLYAKAALRKKYPNKKIAYYFGFPYDPWSKSPTGYNKATFLEHLVEGVKYLDKDEVLIASELWDHLAQSRNTMESLISIINNIATEDFADEYLFINDRKNSQKDLKRYTEIIQRWGLSRELPIIANYERFLNASMKIQNSFYSDLFKDDGTYNQTKAEELLIYLS